MSSSQQPSSEPTNWADDMDSVARLRDRDCFMRIYDYFMPRLCVYLRGLGHPTPWPRKWRRSACCACGCGRREYDAAQGALSTWLYRIARNLQIDRIRRERSWMQVQAAVEDAAAVDVIERSSAEQFADQARLRQRINELPAVQARLVRMSYFEAKSHSEIAQALGMPLGTVSHTCDVRSCNCRPKWEVRCESAPPPARIHADELCRRRAAGAVEHRGRCPPRAVPHCRQRLRYAEAIGSVLLEQTQPPAADGRREQLARGHADAAGLGGAERHRRNQAPCAEGAAEADPDHLPASLHPYFGASLSELRWRWMAPGVHCIRAEQMPSLIMLKIAPASACPCTAMAAANWTQILRGSYNDALVVRTR